MTDSLRKKSPRAPSLALDEALARTLKAYEQERLHPAPTEVVAQNIGYKGANNGSALSALASLRYFGLMERPKEGLLAVTKAVEDYKFSPDENYRRQLLIGFVRHPTLYNELLEKYDSGLPSDANLKFELIQRGFAPQAAESSLATFKRSVEFSGYFEWAQKQSSDATPGEAPPSSDTRNSAELNVGLETSAPVTHIRVPSTINATEQLFSDDADLDRIPVRLTGGRRAWLLIPAKFLDADKIRLKSQIDLLLTEEDELSSS